MTKTAQSWLNAKYQDKSVDKIEWYDKKGGAEEELTGELLIEGYTNIKEIDFKWWGKNKVKNKITKVVIKNCPGVKRVYFNNNEITEITFEGTFNGLEWLELIDNKLTKIDVGKLPNLTSLYIARNPNITEIEGWENLTKLEMVDLYDTPGLNGKKFKEWKEAINSALNQTPQDGPLPDTWKNKLDDLKKRPTEEEHKKVVEERDAIKNDLKTELGLNDGNLNTWKDEIKKLKNRPATDNNSEEIKKLLGLQPTDTLPNDWKSKLVTKTDLDKVKNDLDKWNNKFPGKTPDQVEKDIKDLQSKPTGSGTGAALTPEQEQKLRDYDKAVAEKDAERRRKEALLKKFKNMSSDEKYAQILVENNKIT